MNKNVSTGRVPLPKVLPLSTPFSIEVYPIYACNLKCEFCEASKPLTERSFLPKEIKFHLKKFEKLVNDCKKFPDKLKEFRFVGLGEPLLNPNLSEMIAMVRDAKIANNIKIITNSVLLTEELGMALDEAGLDTFKISINGLNDEDYLQYCGTKVDFKKMVQNITYLYNNANNIKIHVKIMDYICEGREEIYHEIFDPISHLTTIEHLFKTNVDINMAEIKKMNTFDKTKFGEKLEKIQVCPQPFYSLYVDTDGNVIPCCSPKYPLIVGNITDEAIVDIWNGRKMRTFQRDFLDFKKPGVCQTCTQIDFNTCKEDILDEEADRLKGEYE